MAWNVLPHLRDPDWSRWRGAYPDGLGASAFSAPAWQRLMQQEVGPPWRLQWLCGQAGPGQGRSLPVLVKRSFKGRTELLVQPVAYYVMPVESATWDQPTAQAILAAAARPWTSVFTWWLPPWSTWRPAAGGRRLGWGRLTVGTLPTYMIRLQGEACAHLEQRVHATQRRMTRRSLDRGLEVCDEPGPALVDEYYQLYESVYQERQWGGPRFSRAFFHGVARGLGRGGELVIMRLQGRVVGGGVLLYDRHAVHYFQGAVDRQEKSVTPMNLLYKVALDRAQARGLGYVNLGGVNDGNEGLVRYKLAWGAEPAPVTTLRWRSRLSPMQWWRSSSASVLSGGGESGSAQTFVTGAAHEMESLPEPDRT